MSVYGLTNVLREKIGLTLRVIESTPNCSVDAGAPQRFRIQPGFRATADVEIVCSRRALQRTHRRYAIYMQLTAKMITDGGYTSLANGPSSEGSFPFLEYFKMSPCRSAISA